MISSTTSVISAPIWKPRLPPAIRKIAGGLQEPSGRRTVDDPVAGGAADQERALHDAGEHGDAVGLGQDLAGDAVAVGDVDHLVERGRRPGEARGELRALGVGADRAEDERGQDGETETVPALASHGFPSREKSRPGRSLGRAPGVPRAICLRGRRPPKLFVSRGMMRPRVAGGGPSPRPGGRAPTRCRHPSRDRRRTSSGPPSRRTCGRTLGRARRHAVPARAERLPPHRSRQGDLDRLRPRPRSSAAPATSGSTTPIPPRRRSSTSSRSRRTCAGSATTGAGTSTSPPTTSSSSTSGRRSSSAAATPTSTTSRPRRSGGTAAR